MSAIFRALQFAFPPAFRREYGAAMRHDFAEAVRDERNVHGSIAALTFACGAYADLLLTAMREFSAMFYRDLVFAFRSLRKMPTFAAIVVATLALAIAANATAFSVLRAVVLAPLPYPHAERLVALVGTRDGAPFALSLPDFHDLAAQQTSFSSLAAFSPRQATMTGRGLPERLSGINTTPALFETLGVQPMLGRIFTTADARDGSARTIVISESLWRSAFGSDPGALGARLVLDGVTYRVIGVVSSTVRQPNFQESELTDESFWLPLDAQSHEPRYSRGAHYFQGVGRMRDGITLERVRADLATIFDRLAHAYPADDKHFGVGLSSAYESIVGNVRPLLFSIFAAVAGVLLVACANVANLLLSRAASRDREFAIRAAVGASRGRLIAQLLVETFVFAVLGGIVGSGIAFAAVRALVAFKPVGLPRFYDVRFDVPSALYALAIVALCTLVAGIAPALALSRRGVADALKSAGRNGDATRGTRARGMLVVVEVALTLALVVSSGLVVRSFFALTSQPLGFEPDGVVAASIQTPVDVANGATTQTIMTRIEARVRALPGVTDAAWSYSAPFTRRNFSMGFEFAGHIAPAGESPESEINVIGPDYFGTLRQPLLAGRTFVSNDMGSARVAIVNEAFMRKFFAGRRRLGAQILLGISDKPGAPQPIPIVGIVADARTSYALPAKPTIFVPLGLAVTPNMLLVIRTQNGVVRAEDVGAAVAAVDPLLARPKLRRYADYLADDTAQTRLAAITLGALAFVALALSLAGIFAVVSYGVAQRTHEFGVRMALGARALHVVRSAVGRAMRLVAAGILLGVVVAALTTRLIANQLYDIAPLDPLTFGSVAFVIASAALLAALVPATRATRVDPVIALRYE